MYKICKYDIPKNKYVVSVKTENGVTNVTYSSDLKNGTSFTIREADRLCQELNETYSNYSIVHGGEE